MSDFQAVFSELRNIMAPYAAELTTQKDTSDELYVNTAHIQKNKTPLFFGAVQIKKSYVSYHLMPLYSQPALLEQVSDELKKHMQGKSCFNFKSIEPRLRDELAALTKAGYNSYKEQGFV